MRFKMYCVLCGSKVRLEPMDSEKERRIKDSLKYFENVDFVKKVCRNCGHVSYSKIKK